MLSIRLQPSFDGAVEITNIDMASASSATGKQHFLKFNPSQDLTWRPAENAEKCCPAPSLGCPERKQDDTDCLTQSWHFLISCRKCFQYGNQDAVKTPKHDHALTACPSLQESKIA